MPQAVHDCAMKLIAEGKDESSAYAICNSTIGGANFAEYSIDSKGDLYLKYFLADSSFAKNTAVGDFSLNGAAIGSTANLAIGLPFSILPSRDLSIFGDYHPWDPKEGASWDDHVAFASKYSPGKIVAVTANSQLGAAQEVINNGGRFAVVHITDPRARDAYIKNPDLIPKAVSPGIMNLEAPNKTDIKNFKWTHLAAVPQGAYGDKATLYASCLGGNECVNSLIAAGVKQKDQETTYCPIGASEFLSSLDTSETNQTQMSDNANAVTTPVATATAPTSAPAAATQTGAPIASPTPPQPILRLKNSVTPQQNAQPVQGPSIDNKEFEKVQQQLQELQQARAEAETRQKLTKIIPIEIFRVNGKIDEAAYNKEIDKRVKEGWTEEYFPTLEELYNNKMQIIQLAAPTGNPLGGSGSSNYQTPSHVTETVGAGVDIVTEKTKGLFSMFHLEERL